MPVIPVPRLDLSENLEIPSQQVGINGFAAAMNCDLTQGVCRKRPGLEVYIVGMNGVCLGIFTHRSASGVRTGVIVTTTNIYTVADGTTTLTDRTPSGYSGNRDWPTRSAELNYNIFVSTISGIWYWDGSAATFLPMPSGSGAPQRAHDLCSFGNHLIAVNIITSTGVPDPFAMVWSDYLNGTIWNSGDAGAIDIFDGGDVCMAIIVLGSGAVLLKSDSIYQVSTIQAPLFYALTRSPGSIGTIATASVQSVPGLGVFFLSRDDVYNYNGFFPQPVWGRNGETLRRKILSVLNYTHMQSTFAVVDIAHSHYMLFIPTNQIFTSQGTPVYDVFVDDWRAQTWQEYSFQNLPEGISGGGDGGMGITDRRRFSDSVYPFSESPYRFNDTVNFLRPPAFMIGGVATGTLYRFSDAAPRDDAGYSFESTVTTGLSDFGAGYPQRKMIRGVHVLYTPRPFQGVVYTRLLRSDDGGTTYVAGPLNERLPAYQTPWTNFLSTGVFFAIQLSDAAGTEPWEAKAMAIDLEPAADR